MSRLNRPLAIVSRGEDAAERVAPLERGDDVQQRDRGQPHRRGDREAVAVLGPRHDGERADGDQQTGEAQPHAERRGDHRLRPAIGGVAA